MTQENQDLKFILGGRSSPLAKRQCEIVAHVLEKQCNATVSFESFVTSGDQLADQPLNNFGGKGLFCKEVDQACLDGKIDIAVHSAKDMGSYLPQHLEIAAVLERADPHDVLISKKGWGLEDLPVGAHIGTASLRRQILINYYRPDLRISLLRGNVQKRLTKIEEDHFDATILAAAGLQRLGYSCQFGVNLDVKKFIPAVGQGTLALVMHKDHPLFEKVRAFTDQATWDCFLCERSFLKKLQGNCQTPLGAYALYDEGTIKVSGFLGDEVSKRVVFETLKGDDPLLLGETLAVNLERKLKGI